LEEEARTLSEIIKANVATAPEIAQLKARLSDVLRQLNGLKVTEDISTRELVALKSFREQKRAGPADAFPDRVELLKSFPRLRIPEGTPRDALRNNLTPEIIGEVIRDRQAHPPVRPRKNFFNPAAVPGNAAVPSP
jgi:hypothetical protein